MSDISKLDKNFEVKNINSDVSVFYNCLSEPFKLYGLLPPTNEVPFTRMPTEIALSINQNITLLNQCTAGGRIKFVTDSPFVEIKASMLTVSRMPHFALTGSAGFDMYVKADGKERYAGTFIPPLNTVDEYTSKINLQTTKEREITINFPLYSAVKGLEIGLHKNAYVKSAAPYKHTSPVVYYGSSITQGGCASRPGNAYQSIISRELSCDHINLGFSGNAKGEVEMGEYIASLKMSAFVYDYDYNAPSLEHLKDTHYRMFSQIRSKNPTLPIIVLSRPNVHLNEQEKQRLKIIKNTVKTAKASGDENVYFIDGSKIMKLFGGDSGTVDNCHPNDLGFMCMAKVIGKKLKEIL